MPDKTVLKKKSKSREEYTVLDFEYITILHP